jgi:hypothetical protein
MDDYISREAAKLAVVDVAQSRENGFQWGEVVTFTASNIIGLINKIPAADVRPVVRGSGCGMATHSTGKSCTFATSVDGERTKGVTSVPTAGRI